MRELNIVPDGYACSATLSVDVAASLAVSVCATAEAPPGGAGRGVVFMMSAGVLILLI
jgi:hypothetical protein